MDENIHNFGHCFVEEAYCLSLFFCSEELLFLTVLYVSNRCVHSQAMVTGRKCSWKIGFIASCSGDFA